MPLKIIFLSAFLFLMESNANINIEDLYHKWKLEVIEMDGSKEIYERDLTLEFFKDGTYKVNKKGESYIDKWEFIKDKESLIIYTGDSHLTKKIVKLTEREFVESFIARENEYIMYYKRVN